ncbi:uncharacterized protein LOC34618706 [Cyclospora cayetanensis]|uniref:Uncharacterized protein LOC34618706 n=1 Tax=Cyclospora cayetanensis TaxID=88456 RepID=A0A6P6S230_9EIME|nr:uncharacterized protein LOC34618706 [Cyclospora cayetanensis]
MTCQGRATRPVALCLRVFWLTVASALLRADAFSTPAHRTLRSGGSLCTTPSRGGISPHTSSGGYLSSAQATTPGPSLLSRNSKSFPIQLRAEAGTGGENAGPILLAERSVNRVTLIGRVGLDPEVRHLLSGDRMASFSLATSEQWRDKATGEVRSRTEWHRVVVFDKALVNLVEAFVHKGRRLYVDGSLQTRRWVASDGQERYTTEVLLSKYKGELVLLESPEDKHAGASTHRASSPDIAQGGGMARIAGSSQASRSNGGSSEDFESQHESPGATGARNAVAPRGEAGTGVRFNASWR